LIRVLICLALLAPAGALAAGNPVTSSDVGEIRAAIHRQIGALALVCDRPLSQPASVAFRDLVVMSGEVVQQVQVIDGSGAVWVAYYAMQRQRDGSWRTNGCNLVQPARTISA
jgi:Domain of unknown function (DUF4864)